MDLTARKQKFDTSDGGRRTRPEIAPDDELVAQMHDDLYDGLKEEIEEGVKSCSTAAGRLTSLTEALVEGMRIVGIDFRDGILFVPEMLMSANAMKGAWRSCAPCSRRPARRKWARW